ncbi:hypothetical protein PENSPDRAFT_675975 [Peniophora sp. CONT]|nr:hypothetical protein PENSPDRAFT_675975 [Peniophora sp. CONT]
MSSSLQSSASSPSMGYGLNLTGPMTEYTYGPASYTSSPPARPYTPPSNASIFPGALAANMSGAESDQSGRTSRNSSSSHPSPSMIPRAAHRFDPMASSSRPAVRRRKTKSSDDFSDDDDDYAPAVPQTGVSGSGGPMNRREEVRRQRIESEQRRRDELRDGYRRLKDVLPISNQKSSKVALLDRATTHIRFIELTHSQLQTRLQQAEEETQRLRKLNERLMFNTAEQRQALLKQQQAGAF